MANLLNETEIGNLSPIKNADQTGRTDTTKELISKTASYFVRSFGVASFNVTASNCLFGSSIASNGDWLVVGAPGTRSPQSWTNWGSVHIFKISDLDNSPASNIPGPYRWIQNPDYWNGSTYSYSRDDRFGTLVAVGGDYVVVATSWEDTGAVSSSKGGTSGNNHGVVYVHQISTNTTKIIPNPNGGTLSSSNNDYFGSDIAISADGSVIVIGAIGEDYGGNSTGLVYAWNTSDIMAGNWSTTYTRLINTVANGSEASGRRGSIAITNNYIYVGAYGEAGSAGVVWKFNRSNFSLVNSIYGTSSTGAYDNASSTADGFGYAVAANDTHYFVCSAFEDRYTKVTNGSQIVMNSVGAVYVFDAATDTLVHIIRPSALMGPYMLNTYFGSFIDLNEKYLVIGNQESNTTYWDGGSFKQYIYCVKTFRLLHIIDIDDDSLRIMFSPSNQLGEGSNTTAMFNPLALSKNNGTPDRFWLGQPYSSAYQSAVDAGVVGEFDLNRINPQSHIEKTMRYLAYWRMNRTNI